MRVLGVDFETTGLNTAEDHITEVGAVLWDTERRVPLALFSNMIKMPDGFKLDPKITELTGIRDEDLARYGDSPRTVLTMLTLMMKEAEHVVAHNGNLFDRPILASNAARHGVEIPAMNWIDTSCDIDFPPEISTRRLSYLCADHKFLNPFAHRAVFDVLSMLKVADHYDWTKAVEWSKAKTLVIRADSTFQQKELVKKQNYRWDNDNKRWIKSIKDFQLDGARAAAREAGFGVTVIG